MKVSHEVPISLLEKSKEFNDYDYCLLHLTYENPEYRSFYKDSKRDVLLDNSLFELGDSLTNEQLAQGVLDIKPKWYVIPDCLNDRKTTIKRFKSFIRKYKDLPGLKIGVVQGNSLKELIKCYRYMSKHADKIAIPFDSKGFEELCNVYSNPLVNWCEGRQAFVTYLIKHRIWNKNKPHHLLGCSFAREFKNPLYKKYIESVDTSNPVVAGIKGMRYIGTSGLRTKPKIKLCDLINHKVTDKELKDIMYNVNQFKEIIK